MFSEDMQRKTSQATKGDTNIRISQTSLFKDGHPRCPFRRSTQQNLLGIEKDRQQERFSFPQRSLSFFFPLLMEFKVHITEGKVQGLEKEMRPKREAQRF